MGAFGVSFLLVLVNVAVASAWETRRYELPAAVLLGAVLLLCLAGRFSKAEEPVRGGGREVRLVQPNSGITYQSEKIEQNYRRLLELSVPHCIGGDALLVWPESAAWPSIYESSARLRQDVAQLNARGCRVLLSSAAEVGEGWENVALLVGTERRRRPLRQAAAGALGRIRAAQDRAALRRLPGAQRRRVLARPRPRADGAGSREAGAGGLLRGDFPNPVADQVKAGATMLVTITNDAWYGDTAAPWQHLRAARFRAAENRRPLLRAALTRVSAIVDAEGRVQSQLGVGEEGVLAARMHGETGLSPYTRAPWLVVVLSVLLATFAIIRSWRS